MKERTWLTLILGLYFVLGIGYSLLMPVWEAPDEPAHYGYALQLARTGIRPDPAENYEAFQPPLYYWLAAGVIRVVDAVDPAMGDLVIPAQLPQEENAPRFDWNAENSALLLGPLAVRWMGVLIGAVSLLLTYWAVRITFPESPMLAPGVIALAGGIPQFLHIMAAVNNDVIAVLAGAVLFLLLAFLCRKNASRQVLVASAVGAVLLPILTKLTVAAVAGAVLIAVLWRLKNTVDVRWRSWLWVGGGVFVLLFAAAFYLGFPQVVQTLVREMEFRLLNMHPTVGQEGLDSALFRLVRSFWGKVGWLSVGLPTPVLVFLTFLSGLGLIWDFRGLAAALSGRKPVARLKLFSWFALVIVVLAISRNYLASLQIQGRFLFPTLGPLALVIVSGWRELLPGRDRLLLVLLIGMMAALNLYLWFTGVLPVYFQPFLDG